mgnify:CR=1 FL=1
MIKGELKRGMLSMGETMVTYKAQGIAKEVSLYLQHYPTYRLKEIREDPYFRVLAVQPVGETGYSFLYEKGTGIIRFHPNSKFIDIDMHTLAKRFPRWWKIVERSLTGVSARGYYRWQDQDGKIRDKFMVCVPAEGTPYMVAATISLEEFLSPVQQASKKVSSVAQRVIPVSYTHLTLPTKA